MVAVAVAEQLRRHPAVEVTLPWGERDGPPCTAELVVTSRQSNAVERNDFNQRVWKASLVAAGVELSRSNGLHALRHH